MKRILLLIFVLVSLLAWLGGCATAPAQENDDSVVRVQPHFDHERIQMINRAANRAGARVIWVNPPRKDDSESD